MDIQQSCFSGVMLAVGRLVGIEKTIGDKVSSKSRLLVCLLLATNSTKNLHIQQITYKLCSKNATPKYKSLIFWILLHQLSP